MSCVLLAGHEGLCVSGRRALHTAYAHSCNTRHERAPLCIQQKQLASVSAFF